MVLEKLNRLPPFHPSVLKLLDISTEDDAAEAKYEEAFESDPSLTASLLLMANSAAHGGRSTIQTIARAIRHLGLEPVRSLAATLALRSQIGAGARSKYLLTVWAHSIATAVAAEALGKMHGIPGLYTFGLTHDLGRLGLSLSMGEEYSAEMSQDALNIEEANERERDLCGMTHCEAGAVMARNWSFPQPLAECMADHHDLGEDHHESQRLVSIACVIAGSIGFPEVPCRVLPDFPEIPESMDDEGDLQPEALWNEITRRLAALEN